MIAETCPNCGGSGKVLLINCGRCHGAGRVKRCDTCDRTLPASTQFYFRDKHKPDRLSEDCQYCDHLKHGTVMSIHADQSLRGGELAREALRGGR